MTSARSLALNASRFSHAARPARRTASPPAEPVQPLALSRPTPARAKFESASSASVKEITASGKSPRRYSAWPSRYARSAGSELVVSAASRPAIRPTLCSSSCPANRGSRTSRLSAGPSTLAWIGCSAASSKVIVPRTTSRSSEPIADPISTRPAPNDRASAIASSWGRSAFSSGTRSRHALITVPGSADRTVPPSPVRKVAMRSTIPWRRLGRSSPVPDTRKGSTATTLGSSGTSRSPRPRASQSVPASTTAAPATPTRRLRGGRRTAVAAGTVVGVVPPLGVRIVSSRATISSARCHRSAGFFSRHRMTRSASGAGTAARRSVIGRGASVTWAASTCCALVPPNGGCPASISYASTPKA